MNTKLKIAFAAFGLLLTGCKSEPQNLAAQIGPITTTVEPYTNDEGRGMQELRVKFRNNGPSDVAAVYAKIDAFDASGNRTIDSVSSYCIFASATPVQRLKSGQTYETAPGRGYLLTESLSNRTPVIRVDVSVTEATATNKIDTPSP